MSLKINGYGKILTSYTYSVSFTNNNSVFLAVKYPFQNCYGVTINKVRIYEFISDIRHPNLSYIQSEILKIMKNSLTSKVVIRDDSARNYIKLYWNKNYYEYTGYTII